MLTNVRVGIVFGTRPEAIKIAPVYKECLSEGVDVKLIDTGQHRELVRPILELFKLSPDIQFDVMRENQSLAQLTSRLLNSFDELFTQNDFQYILVQGDTTTAFSAGLAAYYHQISIGHIEAGLRTHNRYSPFPEELNRKLLTSLAVDHFAPTKEAAENLLNEGLDRDSISVTGNTVIDALRWIRENRGADIARTATDLGLANIDYVLMTAHRRENIGTRLENILAGVKNFLADNSDVKILFPVHHNPGVRNAVTSTLGDHPQVQLIEAQGYLEFCALMANSLFIVTDSGGIQEEAPYLDKRVLVTRDTTERPEAIESGTAILAGVDARRITELMNSCLGEVRGQSDLRLSHLNPFGDGFASQRILQVIGEEER